MSSKFYAESKPRTNTWGSTEAPVGEIPLLDTEGNMGKGDFQQAVTRRVDKLEKTHADFSMVFGETCDCTHVYECLQRHLNEFHL